MLGEALNILKPAFSIIDKFIEDKDQATQVKAQLQVQASNELSKLVEQKANIIIAEAKGESWLQRNWRPILMLWFAVLVGCHWLGLTAEGLSDNVVVKLLSIIQLGIGGYIIGRTGEKMLKTFKEK